jgi:hypothetical protein
MLKKNFGTQVSHIISNKEHYLKIAKNRPGPRDFSV